MSGRNGRRTELSAKRLVMKYSSYKKFGELCRLPKTTLADVLHGHRPATLAWDDVQRVILRELEGLGATEEELAGAFEVVDFESAWQHADTRKFRSEIKRVKPLIGRIEMKDDAMRFFGLERDPFELRVRGADDILLTPQHQEVFDQMLKAAERQEMIGIWGPKGSGKTMLKLLLKSRLRERREFIFAEVELLQKEQATPSAILQALIYDIFLQITFDGLDAFTRDDVRMFNAGSGGIEKTGRIVKEALKLRRRHGKKCVLIVDDAQGHDREVLRVLKRLYEMDDDFHRLIGIIAIGQPEFHHIATKDPFIEEFGMRIRMVELRPIPDCVEDYVYHRISRAGGDPERIFQNGAMVAVRQVLGKDLSNPLLIGNLMGAAMGRAYDSGESHVDGERVQITYNELMK